MSCKRVVVLYLENATIGDGLFAPEIARTLREYAGMIDAGTAGCYPWEVSEGERGTRLTMIGAMSDEVHIPLPKLPTRHREPIPVG